MGTHIGTGGSGGGGDSVPDALELFQMLDQMVTIFGSTKTTFWPFLESTEHGVHSYKENHHVLEPIGGGSGFEAFRHAGGVHSYLLDANYGMHLDAPNSTDFSFKTAAKNEDDPFSVGMWVLPYDATQVMLMSKYDANSQREWRWYLDGNAKMVVELYDESASTKELGTATTAVTANQWTFVVMTYDGTETAPVVAFYQNATADATTTTTETGAYVNMEELTSPLSIGADHTASVMSNLFYGRVAMPFICGKALSATEVNTLYGIGRTLMGV